MRDDDPYLTDYERRRADFMAAHDFGGKKYGKR